MRKILSIALLPVISMMILSSCLYSGLEELQNSSDKTMTAVQYSYRFAYNDTIKKGTPQEEIQLGRICEVIFNRSIRNIDQNGTFGYETVITYDLNSIQKAGPSGSVTKEQLYSMFKEYINKDGLSKLWVYVTIPDAATISPIADAPTLGKPGDFTVERSYRVTAADGSTQNYMIKTLKGF